MSKRFEGFFGIDQMTAQGPGLAHELPVVRTRFGLSGGGDTQSQRAVQQVLEPPGGLRGQAQGKGAVGRGVKVARPQLPRGLDHDAVDQVSERLLEIGGQRGEAAVGRVEQSQRGRQAGGPRGDDHPAVQGRVADVQQHVHRVFRRRRDAAFEAEAVAQSPAQLGELACRPRAFDAAELIQV